MSPWTQGAEAKRNVSVARASGFGKINFPDGSTDRKFRVNKVT